MAKMKKAYRMLKRNGVFYLHDNRSGTRASLRTTDADEAREILNAKNKAANGESLNIALGTAFLTAADPELATRTWRKVFEHMTKRNISENTRQRWLRAMRSKPFTRLLDVVIVQTQPAHFDAVLDQGGNLAVSACDSAKALAADQTDSETRYHGCGTRQNHRGRAER
jgi:hypothetical protein